MVQMGETIGSGAYCDIDYEFLCNCDIMSRYGSRRWPYRASKICVSACRTYLVAGGVPPSGGDEIRSVFSV